jgi:hypothetical protein
MDFMAYMAAHILGGAYMAAHILHGVHMAAHILHGVYMAGFMGWAGGSKYGQKQKDSDSIRHSESFCVFFNIFFREIKHFKYIFHRCFTEQIKLDPLFPYKFKR